MTARSLFNIILKVLGLYFVKDIVIAIPTLISVLYEFGKLNREGGISTLLISLLTLFIYIMIIYYLVFQTNWIIDKFRLADNVPEDPIPLKVHRVTVISISILIVGLLLVTESVPMLVRGLVQWYQYNKSTRALFGSAPFDYSFILVYAAQLAIGLLFIGNQRSIVNYIELKQRKTDKGSLKLME